ncbi:MAG: Lrp/AsnC ligand binding domain-containing protein [Pseudomonadota bacterium]
MDQIDAKIVAELVRDARIPLIELARRVNLSKTPCAARLKRLQDSGVIVGFTARVDAAKLGLSHIAFVQVSLTDTRAAALDAFNAAVLSVSEIEECHMIAGAFDYLLKVRCRDIASYRRILAETISALPNVSHTSTFVAMEAVKE